MSVSPSGRKRKVGESNPIQPLIGRLVSNQLPEPVRLPSVQLVYAFLHLQVSQALLSCLAIQQLVAMAQEASCSAAVQSVAFAKPPKLSLAVELLVGLAVDQVRTITLMLTCDMPLAMPTLHVVWSLQATRFFCSSPHWRLPKEVARSGAYQAASLRGEGAK